MVSEEIHHFEEKQASRLTCGAPKQGAWTRLENTKDKAISSSDIKGMDLKQLSFLIKAVYEVLPTLVNLKLKVEYIQPLQRMWENC